MQGFGYALSIAAFFWYNRIKMQQISGSTPTLPSKSSPSVSSPTATSPSVKYVSVVMEGASNSSREELGAQTRA